VLGGSCQFLGAHGVQLIPFFILSVVLHKLSLVQLMETQLIFIAVKLTGINLRRVARRQNTCYFLNSARNVALRLFSFLHSRTYWILHSGANSIIHSCAHLFLDSRATRARLLGGNRS
jgi:hypothetical protein